MCPSADKQFNFIRASTKTNEKYRRQEKKGKEKLCNSTFSKIYVLGHWAWTSTKYGHQNVVSNHPKRWLHTARKNTFRDIRINRLNMRLVYDSIFFSFALLIFFFIRSVIFLLTMFFLVHFIKTHLHLSGERNDSKCSIWPVCCIAIGLFTISNTKFISAK